MPGTSKGYKRVYLSAADRQLESLLNDRNAFDRSLLLNILFQWRVLIPDIFFFISDGIERHVLDSQDKSLLEASLQSGVTIPTFRDRGCSSFTDGLRVIREQGIRGLRDRCHNDILAARLDAGLEGLDSVEYDYWPLESIGEQYEELVTRCLARDDIPAVNPASGVSQEDVTQLWSITKRWRTDCVYEAVENTKRCSGEGLQRGQLMASIGRAIGRPETEPVDDVGDLLARVDDPAQKQALRVFLRWMTELYHYNLATALGAAANFQSQHTLSGIVNSQLVPSVVDIVDLPTSPALHIDVSMPPLQVLRGVKPSQLIEIREDKGCQYFSALERWQIQPTDGNAGEVETCLRRYAGALARSCNESTSFRPTILGVRVEPLSSQVLAAIWGATVALAAPQLPWISSALAVAGVGHTVLYRWSTRAKDAEVTLHARPESRRVLPEVNLYIHKPNSPPQGVGDCWQGDDRGAGSGQA